MPAHEQALEYLAVPEQAVAYVGTELGSCVTCRAAIVTEGIRSRSSRLPAFRAATASLSTRGTAVLFALEPTTEYEVGVTVTVVYLKIPS